MQAVNIGDRITIRSQGIEVTGIAETVEHDYRFGADFEPEITGYYIQVRNEKTGKIHYWKSHLDGGTVEVLK